MGQRTSRPGRGGETERSQAAPRPRGCELLTHPDTIRMHGHTRQPDAPRTVLDQGSSGLRSRQRDARRNADRGRGGPRCGHKGEHGGHNPVAVGTFKPVPDERARDDPQVPPTFGWTSSRATRMYLVWHAPLEELLEHFGIEPIPEAPPAELDSPE